jgi:hypothetical protein
MTLSSRPLMLCPLPIVIDHLLGDIAPTTNRRRTTGPTVGTPPPALMARPVSIVRARTVPSVAGDRLVDDRLLDFRVISSDLCSLAPCESKEKRDYGTATDRSFHRALTALHRMCEQSQTTRR